MIKLRSIILLSIGCNIIISCSKKKESDDYRSKFINYFYTDFEANHSGDKLFDSTLYKSYEWMSLKEYDLKLDSNEFDSLYNKLLKLKIDTNDGWLNYFGIYYQFILKNNDSVERLIVLNNDNYFSTDGVKFVRNDTLAFMLKKAIGVYSGYPKDIRKTFFREYKMFKLDTIPYISRDPSSNGYVYFRGRLLRQ